MQNDNVYMNAHIINLYQYCLQFFYKIQLSKYDIIQKYLTLLQGLFYN